MQTPIHQDPVQPRVHRPRPKVVSLTERAAERVREILGNAEKPFAGLRVGVKNGGCAGQEYVLNYAEAAEPLDEVVEDRGVTIFIEPKSVLFLIGSEIDYETSKLASRFVFRNPNETDACGCGESVTIQPAAPGLTPWRSARTSRPMWRSSSPAWGRCGSRACSAPPASMPTI